MGCERVLTLKTIQQVASEIREFVEGCAYGFHFFGAEASFMETISCATPLIDFGQVSHCFLKGVRCEVDLDDQSEKCVLNQAVVAVVFGATRRPQHLSQNDALMLLGLLRERSGKSSFTKAPVWAEVC